MSLWQAEVEKSRFSPDSMTRRKQGILERFLAGGNSGKHKVKFVSPDLGVEQHTYPSRAQPAPNPQLQERSREEARLFKNYRHEDLTDLQLPAKPKTEIKTYKRAPRTPTLPPIDLSSRSAPDKDHMPAETQAARANIDQIANLIIQKSQLEQDVQEREARYQYLLTESQNLNKAACAERDLARQELETLRESTATKMPVKELPKGRYSPEELETILSPHDDFHFKESFKQLERAIRNFVLNAMKAQPDVLRMVDINPSMDFYISKHNLRPLTVFGIRDVRCIVCRGFIMEFLLERVFRVFLFGMSQGLVFKEGFQALCAIDIGRGSKWAANVARLLVSSSSDYNPGQAAKELKTELRLYLSPFMDLRQAPGLEQVLERAISVARDCRLDLASYSLDMPTFGVVFDSKKMDAAQSERGNVAIAYAPIVTRRGNRRGCDYQINFVIAKGKVWRESIFAELQDLRVDPNEELYSDAEEDYY